MNREKDLETIVVLALASIVAFVWLEINWLIYISIGLLVLPLISRRFTSAIGKIWFTFSLYLGIIMNYIVMFIIFYLFLVPISFFQRLTNSNQILRKKKNKSYFHERNHLYSIKDIENPW